MLAFYTTFDHLTSFSTTTSHKYVYEWMTSGHRDPWKRTIWYDMFTREKSTHGDSLSCSFSSLTFLSFISTLCISGRRLQTSCTSPAMLFFMVHFITLSLVYFISLSLSLSCNCTNDSTLTYVSSHLLTVSYFCCLFSLSFLSCFLLLIHIHSHKVTSVLVYAKFLPHSRPCKLFIYKLTHQDEIDIAWVTHLNTCYLPSGW